MGRPKGSGMIENMRRANEKFTHEDRVANGKKSGEVRRAKAEMRKSMSATLNILLTKAIKKGDMVNTEDIQNIADAENINIDAQTAMAVAMVQRAMLGDVQAAQFIRDTIGEKPTDKVEVDQSLTIEEWAKNHKPRL